MAGYALGNVVASGRIGSLNGTSDSAVAFELNGGAALVPLSASLRLLKWGWPAALENVGAMAPTDRLWPVPTMPMMLNGTVSAACC